MRLKQNQRYLRNNKVLSNITIIFILQIVLCWMMVNYFSENHAYNPDEVSFVVIGYICCTLNHLIMQPRILAAIQRLNFIYLHSEHFDGTTVPAIICMMKLMVEVSIELLQIMTTFQIND